MDDWDSLSLFYSEIKKKKERKKKSGENPTGAEIAEDN